LLPYILNIVASVHIVQSITDKAETSTFTKEYFRRRTSAYSTLVILSGGSFPALKMMNSNLLSLNLFGAGMSSIQLASFRRNHLFSTILLENLPQLCLQAFVMWFLEISSTIVIISFISSVFNILTSILTTVVHIVLYREYTEVKFDIVLSWKRRAVSSQSPLAECTLYPLQRTGRRLRLRNELKLTNYSGEKNVTFEIVASQKLQGDACILHGVIQCEGCHESAIQTASDFTDKKEQIRKAILDAFGYTDVFTKMYDFDIRITGNFSHNIDEAIQASAEVPENSVEMMCDNQAEGLQRENTGNMEMESRNIRQRHVSSRSSPGMYIPKDHQPPAALSYACSR